MERIGRRSCTTRLIETGEALNTRIIAEAIARNIMRGDMNHDRKRTL